VRRRIAAEPRREQQSPSVALATDGRPSTAIARIFDALERAGFEPDLCPEPHAPKWIEADCPACKDRSLRVRLGQDGRVLVHCWNGCASPEIVAALGLKMRDLFTHPARPERPVPGARGA
jgi:hypothetical protein